jgi:hypothetical protein
LIYGINNAGTKEERTEDVVTQTGRGRSVYWQGIILKVRLI